MFMFPIPVALICLWARESPHALAKASEITDDLLEHSMALVCAMFISARRNTSQRRADLYRKHLRTYVKGMSKLYPDYNLKPNLHAAFHIYDGLLLFASMHNWWCFPFERLIGHLQRLPHNHIFGQKLPIY
jgi:hypothetical protein